MESPLGRPTEYAEGYDASRLFPIARATARVPLGLPEALPFRGTDLWYGYEFSWLNAHGRPEAALLRLEFPADSPSLVESKSMKLYLNGFAQTRFASAVEVAAQLAADLGNASGAVPRVALLPLRAPPATPLPGTCLDALDLAIGAYQHDPDLLVPDPRRGDDVTETVHCETFRSLCPVTGQPDWASVVIRYRGPALAHAGLLRYLVSYRQHPGFHESTVEQIFVDLLRCGCRELTVMGLFLRRGGLDISPYRTNRAGALRLPAWRSTRQ